MVHSVIDKGQISGLNGAHFPIDFGFANDDVMGHTAANAADTERGPRWLKPAVCWRTN